MKKIFTVILFLVLAVGAQAQTQRSWDPGHTWVYFVGLLEWKDKESFESFPQENRRDKIFVDLLRSSGVANDHIVYLKDKEATIGRVRSTFAPFLRRAEPGDTVLIYFCGHGWRDADAGKTYLATYDASDKAPGWEVGALADSVERNFRGDNVILMIDNCYSGAIVDAVRARAGHSRISYAVMASSTANTTSTGNWTFTESLIYAFRGEPFVDDDSDGVVTFAELEQNAKDDMLFAEDQVAQFAYFGDFDRDGVVAESSKKAAPRVGERIEAYSVDGYYRGLIVDSRGGKYRVRYFGYEESDDEWVTARMIRQAVSKQYRVGSHVRVESEGKWYPARVVEVRGGAHYVAYDGYGKEWNEWVTPDRIKSSSRR